MKNQPTGESIESLRARKREIENVLMTMKYALDDQLPRGLTARNQRLKMWRDFQFDENVVRLCQEHKEIVAYLRAVGWMRKELAA